MESEPFDKRMALEVIEDAFTTMETPEALGFAVGLCGAFYMCGLLEEGEWRELLRRIPASSEERCMLCKSRHQRHWSRPMPCSPTHKSQGNAD